MSLKHRIAEDILNTGLSIIGVMGGNRDDFSYTIGGGLYEIPEVFSMSLPSNHVHYYINQIFANIHAGNIPQNCSSMVKGLANIPIAVVKVDFIKEIYSEYMIQNEHYFGHQNENVMQIVFPDPNGLFPWEEGFEVFYNPDEKIMASNPHLIKFVQVECEEINVSEIFE